MIFFILCIALVIGSFLNVCISRIPREISVVTPRSHCPKCQKTIAWYYNIPIISYVFLLGKCRYCKTRISPRYLLVEILTPILFYIVIQKYSSIWIWPFHFYFMCSLLIASFVDLEHWIIPDAITLPGIIIGLLGNSFFGPLPFIESLSAVLLGGGILLLVATVYRNWKKVEGIGGGDIKFLAMLGAFIGVQNVILTIVLSSVIGSLIGLIIMIVSGKGGKTAIPFGPFLAIGALIAYCYGTELIHWYFVTSRISV